MRLSPTTGLISAIAIGILVPFLRAEDKILEEVKAGHRTARQGIRTFSASIVAETERPQRSILDNGRYWRAGDVVRIQRGKEGDWTADYLVKDGETREVDRGQWGRGRASFHKVRRRPATDYLCRCNVWQEMLFDHAGPEGGQISYERLLELARVTAATRYARHEGRQYAKVFLGFSSERGLQTSLVVWHDVACNYHISKIEATFPGTTSTSIGSITEFAEPEPGLFVPLGCRWEYYERGKLESSRVTTLSDVQVNKPIPASVFSLPAIPSGTILNDLIDGTTGPVGENWEPIGPRKPYQLQQARTHASPGASVYDAPSSSEPVSAGWWVLVASCAVLAAALSYLIFRQLRRNSE